MFILYKNIKNQIIRLFQIEITSPDGTSFNPVNQYSFKGNTS